jgi:hypothetical protein
VAIPVSSAVALLLDDLAVQVDPLAAHGLFLSPFARLSFADKARALRLLDEDQVIGNAIGETHYISGVLVALVAFMAFSEAPTYDAAEGKLRRFPVGWQISGYYGPARGHPDFRGYFQGRKQVHG